MSRRQDKMTLQKKIHKNYNTEHFNPRDEEKKVLFSF